MVEMRDVKIALAIMLLSLLAGVAIGATITKSPPQEEASISYRYRRMITLTSLTASQRFDFPTTWPGEAYAEGKIRCDCLDVLFTDEKGQVIPTETLMCSTKSPSSMSVFRLHHLFPANAPIRIYMYYGSVLTDVPVWSCPAESFSLSLRFVNDFPIPLRDRATGLESLVQFYPSLMNGKTIRARTLLVLNLKYDVAEEVQVTSIKVYDSNGRMLGKFVVNPFICANCTARLTASTGDMPVFVILDTPLRYDQFIKVVVYSFNDPLATWEGLVH